MTEGKGKDFGSSPSQVVGGRASRSYQVPEPGAGSVPGALAGNRISKPYQVADGVAGTPPSSAGSSRPSRPYQAAEPGPGVVPASAAGSRASKAMHVAEPFAAPPGEPLRETRVQVAAQVKLRYSSILDFHESQSVNISRTGMFVASDHPGPVGSLVDFEFGLADGLSLLKGRGEVVRVTESPVSGMGVRFRSLDEDSRKCLERIVAINEMEGRVPEVPIDFGADAKPAAGYSGSPIPSRSTALRGATRVQPGLTVTGHELQVRLTPLTVGYFTNNPLINIRLGGFVIPIEEEVALGTGFEVAIMDNDGSSLFHGKGKVVAKDERRIGIRLSDIDKRVLTRLQTEVAKLSPGNR
jgi:uncharacterized protein (TIGR02266 family)